MSSSPSGAARVAILERLRQAMADEPQPVEVPRRYRLSLPDGVDVVDRFAERVAAYRAVVQRVAATELADALATILTARGIRRLVVPDAAARGLIGGYDAVESMSDDPPLTYEQLDAADGVLTGCAVAVAETGTVVLDGGAGQGRRVLSLLPDHHICVVRADQVVGDVPEALRRLNPQRPLTWISGPSATSDIELNRIEGVHGPRNLAVVIVT